ncbi:TrkA C-terminal domain-containing protein [Campylobacter sp. 9BO]|uniref:COG3400 family protein n=1 Tax=Campylobacter sp. 9BO TaxID=3424759 RepID=UPI003D338311
MKKILIIADGLFAKSFIDKLYGLRSNLHHYVVISNDKDIIDTKNSFENFTYHHFDPTSLSRLKAVISGYFSQFIIIMQNEVDAIASYENLRQISTKTDIVFLNLWNIKHESMSEDKHLEFVDNNSIISTHFVGHLPDMPSLADNIGLGQGEIMEVKVPIGSSYMYRHLSSLQQKRWRIALIYRSGELLLPSSSLMIRPNDTLLIVGDPQALHAVYRSIKREPGQFPSPFGSNIYVFLDMKVMSNRRMQKIVANALYLHENLSNKRLIFRVVNPTFNTTFTMLKEIHEEKISVVIDYMTADNSQIIADISSNDIGFVITDDGYFNKFKRFFYMLKLPILKLGERDFSEIRQVAILSDGKENIENQSAVIMDIASQLKMEIKLYYFNVKNTKDEDITEHFESISGLFEKDISIENSKKNPLLKLSQIDTMLQFITFDEHLLKGGLSTLLSTSISRHYGKMKKNAQLFIPASS